MVSRIVRATLGLGVLGLLIYFGMLDLGVLGQAIERPGLLALAFSLIFATIPIAALRWWVLLISLNYPMTFLWSLRTTFTSQFFSMFLPGAYGGDLVRITLAYRAAHKGLSRITFTVLVDRLSGLFALLLTGLGILPLLPLQFRHGIFAHLAIVSGVLLLGAAAGIAFGSPIAKALEHLPPPVGPKLAHMVREVLAAVRAYFDRPAALIIVLALSIIQFAFVLVALTVLGRSMHFDALSWSGYVVAGVWSIIANAVPFTPGGLGIGETAFAKTATLLEATPSGASYATVFLAMRVITILVTVFGMLTYRTQRRDLLIPVADTGD